MSAGLFFDILDDKRRNILPLFAPLKGRFYLAGGTGLALQIGHRDSIDFYFFTIGSFEPKKLQEELGAILSGHELMTIQQERDTLTMVVDKSIKISYFGYPYPLVRPMLDADALILASVEDIGCMKLTAVVGRATLKDCIDLYFIVRQFSLTALLDLANQKYPSFNSALALKSLTYFDDIVDEPILFKHGADVSLDDVSFYLKQQVKKVCDSGLVWRRRRS
ncbi:MAG: nucleotidyl transferase AbiEii/AbiGii toxin family protein [Capsulimonadaceae bacterium]|nr:nucleotidyl transferase AbiEii/AbiGii toxin family protein [Capsulimonadaceae bacterium]